MTEKLLSAAFVAACAKEGYEPFAVLKHLADFAEAQRAGDLLNLMMLNGKRLGNCTGTECGEIGAALTRISEAGVSAVKPRVRVKASSRLHVSR